MGEAATEKTIRERFVAQWPTLSSSIPYTFDNAGDDKDFPTRNTAWVRVTIQQGTSFQVEMGMTRRWRRPGVVTVQIFIPVGEGTGQALELGDIVRTIFEGSTISGVVFRATSNNRVGIDGPWMQFNAMTPFHADELR